MSLARAKCKQKTRSNFLIKLNRPIKTSLQFNTPENEMRMNSVINVKEGYFRFCIHRLNKKKNWASKSCDEDRTLHVVMSNRSNVL